MIHRSNSSIPINRDKVPGVSLDRLPIPESDFHFLKLSIFRDKMTTSSTEETSSQSEIDDSGVSTKLYVLASIIVLTLLGNVLIMVLVLYRRDNPMLRVQFFMLHLSIGKVFFFFSFSWFFKLRFPYS